MADNRFSIIVHDFNRCLICGSYLNVEKHEAIFGTANRKLSIKYGLVVPLCKIHHTSSIGVHHNRKLDLKIKELAQKAFEYQIGTREEFRQIFGQSYL